MSKNRDFLGYFPRMALKSSYNLFLIAEYFAFQEILSISFGSPIHANANYV